MQVASSCNRIDNYQDHVIYLQESMLGVFDPREVLDFVSSFAAASFEDGG